MQDLFTDSPGWVRLVIEVAGALAFTAVAYLVVRRLLKRGRLAELIDRRARRTISRSISALALTVMAVLILSARNEVIRTDLLLSTANFLPKLVVGALIIIVAFVLSKLLGVVVEQSIRSRSPAIASRLRGITVVSIVTIGTLIAMKQMGLATDVLIMVLGAFLATNAVAFGLGIGLGVLPLSRQIAAGRHVEERFTVGQYVELRDIAGRIDSMGMASARVVGDNGEIWEVPYAHFLSAPVGTTED